jgi:hypothetical protein
MKMIQSATIVLVILAAIIPTSFTPAFALGGCGPNGHRNWAGRCVWGGQNQAWCVRHTGHEAVRTPDGRWVCIR